jgi:phage shock protein PspC (stress-responsive transcriptional regulator)
MNSEIETKKLYRSYIDKQIAGVCGGVAQYFKIDSSLVRIAFAVLTIAGGGSGLLLYLLAWGIVPRPNNVESQLRISRQFKGTRGYRLFPRAWEEIEAVEMGLYAYNKKKPC